MLLILLSFISLCISTFRVSYKATTSVVSWQVGDSSTVPNRNKCKWWAISKLAVQLLTVQWGDTIIA